MNRSGIKRKPRKRLSAVEIARRRILRATFHTESVKHGCVMCANEQLGDQLRRDFAVELATIEAHHVLPKQDLKAKKGITLGDPRMWAPENGIGLCTYHHQRHEHWVQRLPRHLLPARCFAFAASLDLGWLLDREYPLKTFTCDRCGRPDAAWCGLGWFCTDCEHEMRTFDQ